MTTPPNHPRPLLPVPTTTTTRAQARRVCALLRQSGNAAFQSLRTVRAVV